MSGEGATVEAVQEGSRWLHAKPSGEEFAKWFIENVRMHDGMNPNTYLPGVVVIQGSEKLKTRRQLDNGRTAEVESYQTVYTPYAKVDTRLAYFWDLCLKNDWLGEIEKVVPNGALVKAGDAVLPPGFFFMPYPKPQGYGLQLCCSAKVNIYQRERDGKRGALIMDPPTATKVVRFAEDTNTALRCETGAIGRALGMAGMLVIPGSGVATAEDIQEFLGTTVTPEPALPDVSDPATIEQADIRERVDQLWSQLDEKAKAALLEWATEREIDLEALKEADLRPLLAYLERATT